MTAVIIALAAALFLVTAAMAFACWGSRWGATEAERAEAMMGDACLAGGPRARVLLTRAISIHRSPETVWPWLAQLGRGAGWYSWDRLDNGGKRSAEHVLSWVPTPSVGDATAIGYLRHIEPRRELVWWVPGLAYPGVEVRLVVDILLVPAEEGARLRIRMSADATGALARPALWFFRFVDSSMAIRQLRQIKRRVETHGARGSNPDTPETRRVDQYQLYEVIYASGQRAGVRGQELAQRWREAAMDEGLLRGRA